MSVIIRLQNLPWSANALDIRQHFQGLSIPEGGVHIVGGEVGDAFIAFSTDEDARQAMLTDGGKIKEVKLKLMLSSRAEMQKVIEQARQQSVSLQNLLQMPAPALNAPVPINPIPAASADAAKPPDRRDSDTTSNGSREKDRKNERKERSRSRDKNRRDRERDRRRRSRSRDRTRRRRSRERSRDRSKDRDRKHSADASRNSRERSAPRREKGAGGDNVNGAAGRSAPANAAVGAGPVWDVTPKALPFSKGPAVPERVPAPLESARVDMDGRRIMGSGPFPGRQAPGDAMLGPFLPNRDGWQARPNVDLALASRFPPVDRFSGTAIPRQQPFGSEGNDFDGRDDFLPRGANSFRGSFRSGVEMRRAFLSPGRLGTGPGNILGPPGTLHGPGAFPRGLGMMERFESPFPNRFINDRFKRGFEPHPPSPGLCVEIRNMPLDCGYAEIRKFCQGIFLANNSIKMISDNKGHRVGMAYIKLANPESKEQAICLTGNTIRGSVVEVVHLEDGIFEKAVDWYKPGPAVEVDEGKIMPPLEDDNLTCLHIEDLPTYVKEVDVHRIFPDFTISDLILTPANDERKLFVAYANFGRAEDARNALNSRKRFVIGHMTLKVSLCSIDQFHLAVKAVKEGAMGGSPRKEVRVQVEKEPIKIPIGPRSDCILLEGLPYQTSDRDILDFFSDVALVPLRIHIMLDNFNKPSGDAYCEFASYDDTLRAASKHTTMLGKQEISVRPVLRAEMLEALGLTQPDLGPPNRMHGPRPFGRNFGGNRPMGILGNGPRMPHMMGRMGPGPMMGPMGGPVPSDTPIEGFGKPGCVVALENIPFRAEIEEILDIFEGFEVTRDSVIRRFNDMGNATGDARVSLASPSEAQRAVHEMRGVSIRGRPVYLSLL